MAKFRFDPGSLRTASANIRAYGPKQKKRLAVALEFWADDTVAEIKNEIVHLGVFDQGQLMAATHRIPAEVLPSRIRTEVRNEAEHATVAEFGRRPMQGKPPPLLPLVGWAGRKGIIKSLPRNIGFGGEWGKKWAASAVIFRNFLNKRGATKQGKKREMDAEVRDMLTVRFIQRKIFEQGIEGRHPFSRAWDRRARDFVREITKIVTLLQ